jgi:UDP-N-acetylmuramoylalanine--D-glutamate ligase
MDRFTGKKILIVGVGKTGFSLINFFSNLNCDVRVTDIKPIFDLNRVVKKLKRISAVTKMIFGEHVDEDFVDADVVVYSAAVNPQLPQLRLAREKGREVYSEFTLANQLCDKPVIAVCGTYGRTTVSHMIGFTLKLEGKSTFVGGTSNTPFIEYCNLSNRDDIDWVVVEVSALQMRSLEDFHPKVVVFTNLGTGYPEEHFDSIGDYLETKISIIKSLKEKDTLVVNFDKLANNAFFRNVPCSTYWYSRKSFHNLGVMNEVQGTHFHGRRINCNINYHSEFKVTNMRLVGVNNRENLLAAITACKALNVSDQSIQTCVERFPGIPHRLEYLMEKNGVCFYNDSKAETMDELIKSISSFKSPIILIAGGKDDEDVQFESYVDDMIKSVRVLVLVGESKERMNRALGSHPQAYIVGSFEESILLAYQKSRTGDIILLSPGNSSTDFFRDYEERGNYYKKLVYQL